MATKSKMDSLQVVNLSLYLLFCIGLLLITVQANLPVYGNYSYPSGSISCKLYNISYLDCSSRELTAIPPLPPNVTVVNLAFNSISHISQSAFLGQHQTTLLDIQSNCYRTINGTPFQDLSDLTQLHLTFSCVTHLTSTSFHGLFNLRILYLRYNLLESLPDGVFRDLINLRKLDLGFNHLTKIPSQSMAPLHMLHELHMFENLFTSLEFGEGFKNLTHLQELYVDSMVVNSITNDYSLDYLSTSRSKLEWNDHVYLDNKTFVNISPGLRRLDFLFDFDNVTIDLDIFSPLTNLTDLAIPSCFQDAIPFVPSKLQYLKPFLTPEDLQISPTNLQFATNFNDSLLYLDLSFSYVNGIYGAPFTEFSRLRVLNLTGAVYSMQYISPDAFNGLQDLEQLYLAHNQINKLPIDAFRVFVNGSLKTLDLSYNALTGAFVDDNPFANVASITHLNLSGNPIAFITDWIHDLTNLQELRLDSIIATRFLFFDLWSQPLPSLTSFFFARPNVPDIMKYDSTFLLVKKAPNLTILSLAGTSIFSPYTIWGLSKLEYLDLSEAVTEITDFSTEWGNLLQYEYLKTFYASSNGIKSITNMRLNETIPNVEELDFSNNLIQSVAEAFLEYLPKLRYLDLKGNQLISLEGLLHLPVIELLDLSSNSITEIPGELLDKLNKTVKGIDVSANSFHCSCDVEPFRKWILSDTLIYLKPNLLYQCKTPKSLASLSVTQVNLDCDNHLLLYVTTSVAAGLVAIFITAVVVRYRWHIKYSLFLFFTLKRKYRPLIEEDGDENGNVPKYDCFVSYAHDSESDLEWVLNDLRLNLEEGPEPFRLCIGHARDFIPGSCLLEAITEAISNSRKTIVVLSPSYLQSEWCYFETQHAWLRLLNDGQDVLILVLLEPIPENQMTLWLRQFLCKKGYLRWPHNKAGQKAFFGYLKEIIKKPTAVDRRYQT